MNPQYRQTYITELQTVITGVTLTDDGRNGITVRDLAFHPGGGGHPKDHGVIRVGGRQHSVLDLVKRKGDVIIVLDGDRSDAQSGIKKGDIVDQVVDRDRRLQAARTHSLQHAFGAAARMVVPDYETAGMNIRDDISQCDMHFRTGHAITERQIRDMLELVRAAIADNLPVQILTCDSVEAARETFGPILRIDPTLSFKGSRLRTVVIGDKDSRLQDVSMCGGNHVLTLAEIGDVAVEDYAMDSQQSDCRLSISVNSNSVK